MTYSTEQFSITKKADTVPDKGLKFTILRIRTICILTVQLDKSVLDYDYVR